MLWEFAPSPDLRPPSPPRGERVLKWAHHKPVGRIPRTRIRRLSVGSVPVLRSSDEARFRVLSPPDQSGRLRGRTGRSPLLRFPRIRWRVHHRATPSRVQPRNGGPVRGAAGAIASRGGDVGPDGTVRGLTPPARRVTFAEASPGRQARGRLSGDRDSAIVVMPRRVFGRSGESAETRGLIPPASDDLGNFDLPPASAADRDRRPRPAADDTR